MYNNTKETPLTIVRYYLHNGSSLRKTAQRYNIHYQTLYNWVKLYKQEKEHLLLSWYKRPWNRTGKNLEEKIALLKEKKPALTLKKAQEILKKESITISVKGIWGIWKRYGYAGFKKEHMWNSFVEYIPWTKESEKRFAQAQATFADGKVKETAEILNSLPSVPRNELIVEIPDRLLNMRRKIEKMWCQFGKIPLPLYLKKAHILYNKCKKQALGYSALRVGILEVIALEWSAKPEDKLSKIKELQNIMCNGHKYCSPLLFEPHFTLLISESIAHTVLLKIKKAQKIAGICKKLLKRKKHISPYFMADMGVLYMNLEDFREAERWFTQSMDLVDEGTRKMYDGSFAIISLSSGDYREATGASKHAKFTEWGERSYRALFQSILFLMKGVPRKTIPLATTSLELSKKEELHRNIFLASLTIASAYCSIGERARAQKIITRLLPFMEKKKLKKYVSILSHIQTANTYSEIAQDSDTLPTLKLLLQIRNPQYWQAFSYAKEKGIQSHFYRYIFFFPEVVNNLLEEGNSTGLPKTILQLPVFNKQIPVYNIQFLGNLTIYKNQKYLPEKLQPKDTAFLIQLALNAGEPNKTISLDKIYYNFWRDSKNPSRNLSHLLVRIKKVLKMPSHLLEVSYRRDNPVLINKGIHFITDYDEYKQTLVQARAFLRAGEWRFAKREFLQAFTLFRGEPFKKMYDDWSDDKRLEILFNYETEILSFAKELKKRGRKEEEELLKRAEKLVPYLDLRPKTKIVPTERK